jgi:hypothetical protein
MASQLRRPISVCSSYLSLFFKKVDFKTLLLLYLKNALKLFELSTGMNIRPYLAAAGIRKVSAVRMLQNN